jgi:hypothetical protein
MYLSIRKILSAKPWLVIGIAYLAFVALSIKFVVFAVKHQPREVERVVLQNPQAGGSR